MAKVKFQKKEIEKHFKLTEENLHKINMFGTPCELMENELEVEVFPNRPDLLSMHGFLRALKAFMGKEKGIKKYKLNKPQKDYVVKITKEVKLIRPYTVCAIIKNLQLNDEKIKEIIELQEKLHSTVGRNRKKLAIGIYPLDKITLPITYTALPPKDISFIPLESDREMSGSEILTRHTKGKDYAHLLEGKDKFPIFKDANNKILSMPPIINSNETGKVDESTKSVFIECSGSDLQSLNITLNIIVTTLAEMGGQIHQMKLEYEKPIITPNLTEEKMKVSLNNVNKLLGLSLKESDLNKLLPKMGLDYNKGTVLIPAWRSDILHEVDIIEDITIAYGYDNFQSELPTISTIGSLDRKEKIETKIAQILIGLNLQEVSSYHLIKPEEAKLLSLTPLEVETSKTEYKMLRPNLLVPALRTFSENKDNEYPQRIFEIGTIFNKAENETETGIAEKKHLIIALSPSNFTEAKQVLDYIAKSLSINYELKEAQHNGLIEGRSASILISKKSIGYLGEIHPSTLNDFKIKMPISVIEICVDKILDN